MDMRLICNFEIIRTILCMIDNKDHFRLTNCKPRITAACFRTCIARINILQCIFCNRLHQHMRIFLYGILTPIWGKPAILMCQAHTGNRSVCLTGSKVVHIFHIPVLQIHFGLCLIESAPYGIFCIILLPINRTACQICLCRRIIIIRILRYLCIKAQNSS